MDEKIVEVITQLQQLAPEAAAQIVLYGRVASAVCILFGIALCCVSFPLTRNGIRNCDDLDRPPVFIFQIMGGIVAAIVGVFCVIGGIHDALLAWAAPYMYVIQYLT